MKRVVAVGAIMGTLAAVAGALPGVQSHEGAELTPIEGGIMRVAAKAGARRVAINFDAPANLGDGAGAAIDFKADDFGRFCNFYFKVRVDASNALVYAAHPVDAGVWQHLTFRKDGEIHRTRGDIGTWSGVKTIRFEADFTDLEAKTFYIGWPSAIAEDRTLLPSKPGERRFAWTMSHGLNADDDWEATAEFLKKHGFTDSIIVTARGAYGYYDSKIVPRPVGYSGFDIKNGKKGFRNDGPGVLAALEACHKRGIKCHPFVTSWQIRSDAPKALLEELERESRFQVTDKGEVMRGWLCPNDEKNRALDAAIKRELIDYGFDGIQFDYMRYEGTDRCFCPRCLAKFSAQVGLTVTSAAQIRSDPALLKKWNDFRVETLTSVVRMTANYAHSLDRKVEVSAASYRNAPMDYDSVAQDWLGWCREGLLDFICPMDYYYSPDIYRAVITRQRQWLSGTKTKFYPGLGISTGGFARQPLSNLRRELNILRGEGYEGFAIFALGKYAKEIFPVVFP